MKSSLRTINHQSALVPWFILGFLLLAGIVLRFVFIRDMEFKGDEYTLTVMAYRNVFGPYWAQVANQSSVGIPNPPFFVYLMSFPVLYSLSPVFLTLWIALLNVLGIVILFLVLRKIFTSLMALEITAVVASAPWAIVFSRKIWTPDALFPFFALFLYFLVSHASHKRAWKIVLLFLLLALLAQLHMSAWFLPLPLLIFVAGNRPRLHWELAWPLALGLFCALIIWLPYLLALSHDGFASVRDFLASRGGGSWSIQNLFWAFRITGTQGFEYLLGPGMQKFSRPLILGISQWMSVVYQVITVVGFFFLLWHLSLRTRFFSRIDRVESWEKLLSLLFLIFMVIQVCYILFHIPAFPHYNVIFYPFLALLFVTFLRQIVEKKFPVFRSFNSLLIIAVILANLTFSYSFLLLVHRNPEVIKGDYGVPYRLQAAEWEQQLQEELHLIRVDKGK